MLQRMPKRMEPVPNDMCRFGRRSRSTARMFVPWGNPIGVCHHGHDPVPFSSEPRQAHVVSHEPLASKNCTGERTQERLTANQPDSKSLPSHFAARDFSEARRPSADQMSGVSDPAPSTRRSSIPFSRALIGPAFHFKRSRASAISPSPPARGEPVAPPSSVHLPQPLDQA